jgi:hypothetical protein
MGKCIACDEKPLALREEPEVNEIEDCDVVAQIEKKIVPSTFFVHVSAQGK